MKNKKILIVYKDEFIVSILKQKLDPSIYQAESASNFIQASELYSNNDYDFVIINFDEKELAQILEFIIIKNKKQPIITVSDMPICSEALGCEHCKKNLNKIRLFVKDIKDIEYYLENFEELSCKYVHGCDEHQLYRDFLIDLDLKNNIYYKDFEVKNSYLKLLPKKVCDDYIFNNELINILYKISNFEQFDYNIGNDKIINIALK